MRSSMSDRGRQRLRTITIILGTVLVIAPAAALAAHQFDDVPDSNIFHDDIDWMRDNGVTKGCNPPANDQYCPKENVTREQMAAFMHRLETEGVFGTNVLIGSEGFGGTLDDVAADTELCMTEAYTAGDNEIAVLDAQASAQPDEGTAPSDLWIRVATSTDAGASWSDVSTRTSPEQTIGTDTADGATSYGDAMELMSGTTYNFAIEINGATFDDVRCNLVVSIQNGTVTPQPTP